MLLGMMKAIIFGSHNRIILHSLGSYHQPAGVQAFQSECFLRTFRSELGLTRARFDEIVNPIILAAKIIELPVKDAITQHYRFRLNLFVSY